jgi:probable rRNA maturation factor
MDPDSHLWEVVWESEEDEPPPHDFRLFFEALSDQLQLRGRGLTLLLCGEERIRQLNARFRGQDKVTDVLSFPSSAESHGREYLGDLAICFHQARKQARELGQTLAEELHFLVLHGVLHLIGYDHESDQGEMLAKQKELQRALSAFFPGVV